MPWDGTQLHVASLTDDGTLADETIVAGGAAESIVQPEWLTSDRILFASDQNGFWNLYSYDASGIYCAYPDEAEYSGPAWGFGSKYYCVLGPRHVVAQRMHKGATSAADHRRRQRHGHAAAERVAGVLRTRDDRTSASTSSAAAPIGSPRSRRWI